MSRFSRAWAAYRRNGLRYLLRRVSTIAFHKLATPIETVLLFLFRLKDIVTGICVDTVFPLREPSLYRLDPPYSGSEPFYYLFPLTQLRYRLRLTYDYEIPVMDMISEQTGPEKVLWEVGSAWGYHSLAFAPNFAEVVCFEQDEELADTLQQSIEYNDYTNMAIVREHVESLDRYLDTEPDIVLMDIDGWEDTVLRSSPEALAGDAVWIIELHEDPGGVPPEIVDPDHVVELFEANGYEIEVLDERGSISRFGRERSDLNNWHIVARPIEDERTAQ